MMGIQDLDTVKGLQDDFRGSNFPTKHSYELALCKEIEVILDKIAKKASPVTHSDAINIIIDAKNLREVRN